MSGLCSRREFLRLVAVGAVGAALAACKPKVVEKVVKETVVVEVTKEVQPAAPKKKIVRALISSWALGEIPFDKTAREYSEKREDVEVKVQSTFEGWETKVRAQISQGKVEWSIAGIMSTDYHPAKWVRGGLVQPMDDYIASSKEEGADQILEDMIPTVKEAGMLDGKLYGIPYSFENITFNWRPDYFKEVGATEPPKSWDEWLRVALELKKWGAKDEIYPTSFVKDMNSCIVALLCAASKKPYTDEGLVDWLSPEMIEALAFFKKMVVEKELTPPHGYDGWLDAFYAGKVASVQAQSSRGVWGQNAFGTDKCITSPLIPKAPGEGSGAPYWGNDLSIVNKAPYPQEATDYLIYTMGPQNLWFQKTVIRTGKTPVYNSIYEKVIKSDPQFRVYQWMIGMREDVERAIPMPKTTWVDIQYAAYGKHIVNFTEPGSTMTPEECAKLIYEDVKAEVAKQKTK